MDELEADILELCQNAQSFNMEGSVVSSRLCLKWLQKMHFGKITSLFLTWTHSIPYSRRSLKTGNPKFILQIFEDSITLASVCTSYKEKLEKDKAKGKEVESSSSSESDDDDDEDSEEEEPEERESYII